MTTPPKSCLIVRGGWDGHTPVESTDLMKPLLEQAGYTVEIAESTARYAQGDLPNLDLIVQCVTMSEIQKEEWEALRDAVRGGVGFAGWHGGIIDSFRQNTDYQWMTGGQWVAHPGNIIDGYEVVVKPGHPITDGLSSFRLQNTEQYYIHIDPGVNVLCETVFSGKEGDTDLYPAGVRMPYAWTRMYGKGKVFVACWGHTFKDFDGDTERRLVLRGLCWAGGSDPLP
jgi:type 1 glutamine amidotransferase